MLQVQNAKNSELTLFSIKYFFPLWLRKIIFSSFNPFYAFYKKGKRNYTISYPSLHPMAIDFICYSLTEKTSPKMSFLFTLLN
jgi:hypothetical protein